MPGGWEGVRGRSYVSQSWRRTTDFNGAPEISVFFLRHSITPLFKKKNTSGQAIRRIINAHLTNFTPYPSV